MNSCVHFDGGDQAPKQVTVAKAGAESCNAKLTHDDERNKTTERYNSFVNTPRLTGGLTTADEQSCLQESTMLICNSDSNPINTSDLCDVCVDEDYNLEEIQTGHYERRALEKFGDDASDRVNDPDEDKSADQLVAVLDSNNCDLEEIAPTPEVKVKHNSRVLVESTSRLGEGNIKIVRVVAGIIIVILFGFYFTIFLMKVSWLKQ